MENLKLYDYESYKAINPKLTNKMYNHLKNNRNLWRVVSGLRCEMEFENEVLEEVWWLNKFNGSIDKWYNGNDR